MNSEGRRLWCFPLLLKTETTFQSGRKRGEAFASDSLLFRLRFRGCAVLDMRKHDSAVISYSLFDFKSPLKGKQHQHCFTCSAAVSSYRSGLRALCLKSCWRTERQSLLNCEKVTGIKQRRAWVKTDMGHDKHLIWNSLIAFGSPHMNFYANAPFFSPLPPCLFCTVKQRMCWNEWDGASTGEEKWSRTGNSVGKMC